MTAGIWLLDLMAGVCGTLFVLGSLFGFVLYMNSSERAQLYKGVPYHATTFRVTFDQYSPPVPMSHSPADARATGIVEGQKETMELIPYLPRTPRGQGDLNRMVPTDTLIHVYLFPTLRGAYRIQPILEVPTEERYWQWKAWTVNRAFPVIGLMGMLTLLLSLARVALWRSAKRRLSAAHPAYGSY